MQGNVITGPPNAIENLLLLVREKVLAAQAAGINWKLVINGGGGDIRYIFEEHGDVMAFCPQDNQPSRRNGSRS
jgi:hypothetical protein